MSLKLILKKILPPDALRAEFTYTVGGKSVKILLKEGEEFTLKGKNEVPQVYFLEELDLKGQSVLIVDEVNGEFKYQATGAKSTKKNFNLDSFLKEMDQQ